MKKFFLFIVVLGLVGGWWYFYGQQPKEVKAPVETAPNSEKSAISLTPKTNSEKKEVNPTKLVPAKTLPSGATFSDGSETDGVDVSVVAVEYDGFKYSPSSVNIKVGDYLVFKNKSSDKFWPASNPHPAHDDYSAFDPKKPIDASGKWQFQFTQAGEWKFHDHLNPSARGVVNVSVK